jgi:hypothetical protein
MKNQNKHAQSHLQVEELEERIAPDGFEPPGDPEYGFERKAGPRGIQNSLPSGQWEPGHSESPGQSDNNDNGSDREK